MIGKAVNVQIIAVTGGFMRSKTRNCSEVL